MGFKKVKKNESFAQWFIGTFGQSKFDMLINHKKNIELGLDIWTLSKRSTANIWFYCENKPYHEFCLSADKYCIGCRCKYCTRTKYVHPLDSVGQYITDHYGDAVLKSIWSDKNEKSAFKYSMGTDTKLWFRCLNKEHEDQLRLVRNVIRSDLKCSCCVELNNASQLQEKVYNYLTSLGYTINTEYKCTIIPKNPKTNAKLPFDNEVLELKLIIEIHGRQHYELMSNSSKWLHDKTPEEYLHDRQLKDRYKKFIATRSGYFYLEIPYWCDDYEESWKVLIDETINNIKKEQRLRRIDYISDVGATV